MIYEEFEYKVRGICATADDPDNFPVFPEFSIEDGIFKANCGGILITGRKESERICVSWGAGHQAFATF